MIYNVVLVSGVQQSDSDIYIYTHTHTHTYIFSVMIYHRLLNIVPCAIQQDFGVYPFSIE